MTHAFFIKQCYSAVITKILLLFDSDYNNFGLSSQMHIKKYAAAIKYI